MDSVPRAAAGLQECIATWINTDGQAYNGTVPEGADGDVHDEGMDEEEELQGCGLAALPAAGNGDAEVGGPVAGAVWIAD